jgi:hypothetical protein
MTTAEGAIPRCRGAFVSIHFVRASQFIIDLAFGRWPVHEGNWQEAFFDSGGPLVFLL